MRFEIFINQVSYQILYLIRGIRVFSTSCYFPRELEPRRVYKIYAISGKVKNDSCTIILTFEVTDSNILILLKIYFPWFGNRREYSGYWIIAKKRVKYSFISSTSFAGHLEGETIGTTILGCFKNTLKTLKTS